ncbi:MAG: glycoside hydrolase family 5 protein [Alloprevotella sp.]|nr:glycoside hydrolase family 5 protein [Alloprevotella sp.]
MTKRLLTAAASALLTLALYAQGGNFETATEAAQNMKVGWNLGNTLDSHATGVTNVTKTETYRGQPVTNAALMQMLKEAGFNAVRVPVTWYPYMASDGTVDAAWIARVKEVVDYVIGQGMYCIVNVHHDTGVPNSSTPDKGWLRADESNYAANKDKFEYLWTQIAEAFKDYGQLLLFEGYNELLDAYGSWNYASWNTENKYDEDVANAAYNAVNSYAQSFVTAVRATGGNNTQRNLILNTYAACSGRGRWRDALKQPLDKLQLPEDGDGTHLAVEVHTYPVITTTDGNNVVSNRDIEAIEAELIDMFEALTNILAVKGAPVIIGEWSSGNVDAATTDYDARRQHMLDFASLFVAKAKEYGMPTFYWLGLSDKIDRTLPAFTQPDLAETILQAYYGNSYTPMLPVQDDYEYYPVVNFYQQWAELDLYQGPQDDYSGIELELSEKPGLTDLRLVTYRNNNTQSTPTNFSTATKNIGFGTQTSNPVTRVTLQWRKTGSKAFGIKHLWWIKSNGTKVEVVPNTNYMFNNCWIGSQATPNFIKVPVGSSHYATLYYSDTNFVVPAGITASAYAVSNGHVMAVRDYEAGEVLPAGTGVVLNATEANTFKFIKTTEEGLAATGNMLRGSDTEELTTGGSKYYKLSLNHGNEEGTVGFYYGAADGAAFMNGAHKAYLAVPESEARIAGFAIPETDGKLTGGITSIGNELRPANGTWYTLDGRLLRTQPTKRGVYIMNGRKVIIP